MGIKLKYFLNDKNNCMSEPGYRFEEVFFFSEEIDLVDCCFCHPLAKKLNGPVQWFKRGDQAVVQVLEEDVDEAIKIGKQIIIEQFQNMSTQYLNGNVKDSVLDEYSIIATFVTDNPYSLCSWCNNISPDLLVKTNLKGERCVITNDPLEYPSRLQAAYKASPIEKLINFNYEKL